MEDDYNILLTWKGESYASLYPDPQDYVYETSGKLFNIDEFGEGGLMGKFRVYYVDAERATNQNESLYHVLDDHSAELEEYYEAIFNSDGDFFTDRLLETVNHEINGFNVLIIDRLELLPHYRKKRLGLIILRHLIDRFSSGAAIVAIKPFPLQFESVRSENHKKWRNKLALGEFSTEEDLSNEKLRRYYAQLGFNGLGSSPFMVMSTATLPPDD